MNVNEGRVIIYQLCGGGFEGIRWVHELKLGLVGCQIADGPLLAGEVSQNQTSVFLGDRGSWLNFRKMSLASDPHIYTLYMS